MVGRRPTAPGSANDDPGDLSHRTPIARAEPQSLRGVRGHEAVLPLVGSGHDLHSYSSHQRYCYLYFAVHSLLHMLPQKQGRKVRKR